MSKHVALNAFLAIGMTFVIVTGGIDLSVGSIVGLCAMVAGGLILHGIDLQIGYTLFFSIPEIIVIILALGVLVGLDQRAADHLAERRAVHRHARLALCRARRGAAGLRRRDLPQPRGQRPPSARPATLSSAPATILRICRCRSGCWSSSRWRRPIWRAGRRSGGTSSRSAATSARRRCRASASTG